MFKNSNLFFWDYLGVLIGITMELVLSIYFIKIKLISYIKNILRMFFKEGSKTSQILSYYLPLISFLLNLSIFLRLLICFSRLPSSTTTEPLYPHFEHSHTGACGLCIFIFFDPHRGQELVFVIEYPPSKCYHLYNSS